MIMNSIKTICSLFILFFSCFSSSAQSNNPLINSGDITKRAMALNDAGKHKDAIELLKQVSRSDSNYNDALYQLSYSYYADSEKETSLKYAKQGLVLFPEYFLKFSLLEANVLDELHREDEAQVVFDQILEKYPQSVNAYFNKSVSLIKKDKNEEAKATLEKGLLIDPYYSNAHYLLGTLFLKDGELIPAMLALNTYLIEMPAGEYASSAVTLLSSISKVTDEVITDDKNKIVSKDDNFDFLQQIVISRIALDKTYKLKAQLEDPIVRQIQVVDEKLQYNKNDKGFCMQFYVPLYQQVFANNDFEPLIFTMFSGLGNKTVDNWEKKNKKQADLFLSYAAAYWDKIRSTRVLDYEQRKIATDNYLFSNGVVFGKGAYSKDKNGNYQFTGKCEFYSDNGNVKTEGSFNNDYKKEGTWTFYYDDGKVKEKAVYKNGEQMGVDEGWWDNGNRNYTETLTADKVNGIQTIYYYNDNIKSVSTYKDDKKNGPSKSYNTYGELTYTTNYVDDKEDGDARSFYGASGKLKDEVTYKNGKAQGIYKGYAENGTVTSQGQFVDDLKQGFWSTYFDDGAIEEKVTYADNEVTGQFTSYFENGKLSRKGNYTKKKLDGQLQDYDDDGILYNTAVYEKGKLKEISFYDKSGKTIYSTTTRKGAANIVYYTPDGTKESECYYNKDGNQDGKNIIYYPSGKIKEEEYFKDGVQNGSDITYYANGQKTYECNYTNGDEDGYLKKYYANGQLSQEGWKVAGQKQQRMIYYNNLGDITSIENYLNDDEDGYAEYKFPGNIPDDEYKYTTGWLEGFTQFDTLGNIISSGQYPQGKGACVYKNYNGKISSSGNYDHYILTGNYKTYFYNGKTSADFYYKDNNKDSIYRSYFLNGNIRSEGNYKEGDKNGIWKYYYENGKLSEQEGYKNGSLTGKDDSYNQDGTKDFSTMYKDNNKEGQDIVYGDSNKVVVVLNYKAGQLMSYTYEDKNGVLVQPIIIKEGSGKIIAYYKNGAQSCALSYADNVQQGQQKFFFSNGKLYIEANRVVGYEDGLAKVYYPNGALSSTTNYVLDNTNGAHKAYYPNGKIKADDNYYNDELNGICKYYDEQGNVKQFVYYHGNLISAN